MGITQNRILRRAFSALPVSLMDNPDPDRNRLGNRRSGNPRGRIKPLPPPPEVGVTLRRLLRRLQQDHPRTTALQQLRQDLRKESSAIEKRRWPQPYCNSAAAVMHACNSALKPRTADVSHFPRWATS